MSDRPPAGRALLLLDIDGVLVHPAGYQDAMRATVDHFAERLGQPAMHLSTNEIAVFEACGITNEWDSGAICASAMLIDVLAQQPDLRRDTLDTTLDAAASGARPIRRPDFAALARAVPPPQNGLVPSTQYLALIADQVDSGTLPLATALLGDVYSITAPVTRVFQSYTLGSERFAVTYGHPAPFDSPSYLITRDRPLLSAASRERLLAWRRDPRHGVTVFTARPSLPPTDVDGIPAHGFAPEGELALELLGLASHVPLIGQGRMKWLADRWGRAVSDYMKPSPVQALAAIAAAASGSERASLESAAVLVEDGALTGPLATLAGEPVQVIVCEDATGGIRAVAEAAGHLRRAGLTVTVQAVGVSPHADKRAALVQVAGQVVDTIDDALAVIIAD